MDDDLIGLDSQTEDELLQMLADWRSVRLKQTDAPRRKALPGPIPAYLAKSTGTISALTTATVTVTGSTTSGGFQIESLSGTSTLFVGMTATGSGIPTGAVIVSVDSSSQVTLSLAATASASVSIVFSGDVFGSGPIEIYGLVEGSDGNYRPVDQGFAATGFSNAGAIPSGVYVGTLRDPYSGGMLVNALWGDAAVAGSLIYTLANPIEPFEFSFVSPVTTGGIVNTIMQDFAGCKRVDSLVVGNHGDIADPTNEFNTANTGENPYSFDRVIPWASIITNGWIVAYNHDDRQDDITVGTLGGTIKLGIGTPGNLPENESAAIVYDGQLSVISGFLGFGGQIYQGLENNGVVARGAVLAAGAMNFFLDQANARALVAGGPLSANTAVGLPRLSIYGQQQTQDSVEITPPVLWDGQWGLILDSLGKPCSVVGANYLGNGQWGFTNYPAYVAGGIVAAQLSGGSGSGSGGGGGGGGKPYRVSLGTASASGTAVTSVTATIPDVTVPAGTLLVVQVGVVESGTDGSIVPSAATFAGHALNEAISSAIESSGILNFTTLLYSLHVTSTTTGDLVVTVDAGGFAETWLVLVSAEYVSGLVSNISDKTANNTGLASAPNSGTTGTTATANEYAESAFMLLASSAGTWGGGFTSGGQDVSGTLSGSTFVLTEGYEILSAIQTVTATMTGSTTAWSGCVVTCK